MRRNILLTGCAGFIGSHILEALLKEGHFVRGVDNLSTGSLRNLDLVCSAVGPEAWERFLFIDGHVQSLTDFPYQHVDVVIHQAALGSVPRSIDRPDQAHVSNVDGFFYVLESARRCGIKRVVYASSSSVYGDGRSGIRTEAAAGRVLSPYAATKRINELYAEAFESAYGLECIGLRYFNVFGPRQNPEGDYAAVIPKWTSAMRTGNPVMINGDGSQIRDFTYVQNVVQANLLAIDLSLQTDYRVFNVGCGQGTSIRGLFDVLSTKLGYPQPPSFGPCRPADIAKSVADISLASRFLGYTPKVSLEAGLDLTLGVG